MMNKKAEYEKELHYHTIMSLADEMLAAGLITEGERGIIDTIMLEKYRPTLGMLLSGKPLI